MPLIPYLLCRAIYIWLDAAPLLIILRALLSFSDDGEGSSPLTAMLALLTEPLIVPARLVLGERAMELPIDMAVILTMILLPFVQMLLPAVTLA